MRVHKSLAKVIAVLATASVFDGVSAQRLAADDLYKEIYNRNRKLLLSRTANQSSPDAISRPFNRGMRGLPSTRAVITVSGRSRRDIKVLMRSARLRAAQPNQSLRGRLSSGRRIGGVLLSTGEGTTTVAARRPSSQAMRGANGFGRSGMRPRGMGGRR
jgi:hypothetical protein